MIFLISSMEATINLSTSLYLHFLPKFILYLYDKVLLGNNFCFVWELYGVVYVRDYVAMVFVKDYYNFRQSLNVISFFRQSMKLNSQQFSLLIIFAQVVRELLYLQQRCRNWWFGPLAKNRPLCGHPCCFSRGAHNQLVKRLCPTSEEV